jgi:hypothetical protein
VIQLTQPYDIAGSISFQILDAITQSPAHLPKDPYIESALDQIFGNYDWSKSFTRLQVIVYDEVIPSEILPVLHKWLRRKTANISNIMLLITHHRGITRWWRQYCNTWHVESFRIQEIFFTNTNTEGNRWFKDMPDIPSMDFFKTHKNIKHLFSYYGGSYSNLEREYLLLKMLELSDNSIIDFIGVVDNKQQIINYAEHITYYKNQIEIDALSDRYNRYIDSDGKLKNINSISTNSKPTHIPKLFSFSGFQWEVDSTCFCCVVRETINSDVYSCLTEKTLRAFLNHQTVIPLGYAAVKDLEEAGFWFPHDIIDYSYQFETKFSNRVNGMLNSIQTLLTLYSMQDLQEYFNLNLHNYYHNATVVYQINSNRTGLPT